MTQSAVLDAIHAAAEGGPDRSLEVIAERVRVARAVGDEWMAEHPDDDLVASAMQLVANLEGALQAPMNGR
jgi:hypothetical protein